MTLTKCMLKPCNNKFFTHTHTPMELLNSIVPIYGKANFPLGPGTSPNGRTSGASWATEWEYNRTASSRDSLNNETSFINALFFDEKKSAYNHNTHWA